MITRDAKIGLLVVLAFCLIVGILLSEHVTTSTAPQQASLAQAGTSARRSTNAPAAVAPQLAAAVIDADPQPKTPVVTRDVIDAPPTVAQIAIGQPANGVMKVIRVDAAPDAVAGAVQVAVPAVSQPTPAVAAPAIEPVKIRDSTLVALAKQQGLELVAVDAKAKTSPAVSPTAEPMALATKSNVRTKEFVAQPGDTLNKMAGRMLGSNTPANRQAIIDLNPSLQKNPERILVGAKYLVPADAWSAAMNVAVDEKPVAGKPFDAKPVDAKTSAIDAAEAKVVAAAARLAKSDRPAVASVAYEVKSGDSLWKLANNDPAAFALIKAMNADVLKGGETVRVGQRLALPAKKKA